jgi:putative ABC transport system permease protein
VIERDGLIDVSRRGGFGVSWLDVKLGIRMLGKEPLLTAVAILTLAIGIPASLTPVHILGMLDSTFPVEEGERIVGIRNWNVENNGPEMRPLHSFAVWREELRSFEAIGAARSDPWNVHSEDGRAEEIRGAEVSASVFTMLRVLPMMGRTLLESDEVIGAPNVVVIAEDVWASRFGRDPDIVGKAIGIGRTPHTVVGVMPGGFLFPMMDRLWLPLRANPVDYTVGTAPDLYVFGRLADGVSQREASAEIETVGSRLAAEWPETHTKLRPEVVSIALLTLGEPASGMTETREILLVQIFCLALLFVACGNVGTMILARTATRVGELGVRTALGASRARIISQLFVESMVLALLATGLGIILADQVVRQFAKVLVDELPYWFDIGIGLESIMLALGLGTVCAVGAGVFPALKATSKTVQRTLQGSMGGGTVRFGIFTTLLVIAEVALSMGFLSIGVVVTYSVIGNQRGDVELPIERYLTASYRTVWVDPTAAEADTHLEDFRVQVKTNQDELRLRLQADPAVRRVAMGANLPALGHPSRPIEVEGDISIGEPGRTRIAQARVDVNFFRDMSHPILEGRDFSLADLPEERGAHRPSVVVNTSFVRDVLGGGGAIGQRIRYAVREGQEPGMWYEIVGVVGSLGMNVRIPDRDAGIYHPWGADEVHPMRYLIEVDANPGTFVPRLREIASEIDPDAMIQAPRPVEELVAQERLIEGLASLMVVVLSLIGTLLAAAGLYALMSFTVSQRTREIGIRSALGARTSDVVGTIARRAAFQLAMGVVAGCALGTWMLREMTDDIGIVSLSIPLVLAGVGSAVVLMVAGACLPPILRGLRIQPTEALREG